MPQHQPRAGVCLLRIEAQLATVLITVRQNPDITTFSAERLTSFSELEPAIAEVRNFLQKFTAGSPGDAAATDVARPPGT